MSDATGYPLSAIKGERRTGPLVKARQSACFIVRRFTGRPLPETVKNFVRDGAMSCDLALKVVKDSDGNAEKAIEVAEAAVATAKAAGKSKATAKHLPTGEPRETLKGVVKDILREAEIEEPASPEGDDLVTVKVSWDLYMRLKALV